MAAAVGGREAAAAAPVFVQLAGAPLGGSGAPRPVTPVIAIPNNHLSYALTWFGLALALAVVTVLASFTPLFTLFATVIALLLAFARCWIVAVAAALVAAVGIE